MDDTNIGLLIETLDANLLSIKCVRNGHRLEVVHNDVFVDLRDWNHQTVATLEALLFLHIIDIVEGYSAYGTQFFRTQQKEKTVKYDVRVCFPETLPITKRIGARVLNHLLFTPS